MRSKTGWTTPRLTNKVGKIIQLMISDEGVTVFELQKRNLIPQSRFKKKSIPLPLRTIEDDYGFIVKSFPCPGIRRKLIRVDLLSIRLSGRLEVIYKIVGRCHWDADGIDDYTINPKLRDKIYS